MNLEFTPQILLPGAVIPIALALAWHAWRLRRLPGATPFVIIAGTAMAWSAFNALELASTDLQGKLLWGNLQYIEAIAMPLAWLLLAVDYTGRRSWITVRRILPILIVPLTTLALIWTNEYHHLIRAAVWLDTTGSWPVLGRTPGIWFWVQVAYSYVAISATVLLLVGATRKAPAHHRGQPLVLIGGLTISLLYNAFFILWPGLLPAHDFTPAVFGITAALVVWGLLRFRLFSLVPIARHKLVERMEDGVLVLDHEHRVVDFNEAARRLLGLSPKRILERPLGETWSGWQQLEQAHLAGSGEAGLSLDGPDGRRDYEVKMWDLMADDRGAGRMLHIRDVTERSLMEENLRRQALTDSLTGLPNRTLFMSKLDDAVRQARRRPNPAFAVIVLDLDRFKLVNDSIGHLAGDFLLEKVAMKLKSCVRDVDVVARMGGDEFMILLHSVTTAIDILPVVERIRSELRMPIHFDQHEMAPSASLGVALWENTYEGPEEILRAADTAMYRAKESGGSCCKIFDERMHEEALQALQAEIELRAAVKGSDFALDYQPIVDLASGEVRSLEALVRWRHAERGTIMPGQFIKMAEDSGLIVPLGALTLEKVCAQMSLWRAPDCPAATLPININISPRQLTEDDFVAAMLACMHEWRVDPHSIILELTETALIRDPAKSKQVMLALQTAGMTLCLDDFGTGWSSLRHLTTFPVRHLKIDRSFVSRISTGNTELEIIRALTGLAHSIGLEVTGEGVESDTQMNLLAELGCDHAQGYFIGRPMAPEVLVRHLEKRTRGVFVMPEARHEWLGEAGRDQTGADSAWPFAKAPHQPKGAPGRRPGTGLAPEWLA